LFFFFFFLSLSGSKNPTPNQQTTKRKRNQDITTKAINGGLRKTNTHGDEWQEITNGGGLAAVELHSVFQHRTDTGKLQDTRDMTRNTKENVKICGKLA